jgi:hypothetical protein
LAFREDLDMQAKLRLEVFTHFEIPAP